MGKLLAITNHNPEKWDEEQKKGWDEIIFVPFPNIPSELDTESVAEIADEIYDIVMSFYRKCDDEYVSGYIMLQGEFSLCKLVFDKLHKENVKWAFPTTDRKVIEKINEDGTVTKTSVFQFVRWRLM